VKTPGTGKDASGGRDDAPAIRVHLDRLLAERQMTLAELSDLVGITVVNLSVLKNGHARAIRFSTLAGLCEVLDCQPGDLLAWEPDSRDAFS
jgi:putative transcriptional regulator